MAPSIFKLFGSKAAKNPAVTQPAPAADAGEERLPELFAAAEAAAQAGQTERALAGFAAVIERDPGHARAHYKLGNLLNGLGRLQEALARYDRAIQCDPDYANAHCNRGVVLGALGRPQEARDSYDQAIARNPGDALALYNRAAVLRQLGLPLEALDSVDRAIAINPNYAEAHCNRGILLMELKRFEEAAASHERALEIHPGFARAWFNRGVLLQRRRHGDAALASYARALDLDPLDAEAHTNRGVLLTERKQWPTALASLDRAIALRPDFAEAHFHRGNLFAASGRALEAVGDFDRAIALKPGFVAALCNRAHALAHTKQYLAAIESFEQASSLEPDHPYLPGVLLHTRMNVCDWSAWAPEIARLRAGIESGAPTSPPFQLAALLDSPRLHRRAAELWTREEHPANDTLPSGAAHPAGARIRIGYFSADFHEHPVAVLMAPLLESHDRSKFELTAFSFGPDVQDGMRGRLMGSFDRFIDVRGRADQEIAQLARGLGIDLAVDLMGHTGNGRPGIFALRAAPVQVSWLGYAGTMGAGYIDYLIADRIVIPAEQRPHYTERVIRLPGSYLPTDSTRPIAETAFTRPSLGLPAAGFVFCCFNNNYKITPDAFDGWMRILGRVPNSVLWLSPSNPVAVGNLRDAATQRGIDAQRLLFAERMASPADHLARLRVGDLFLDTRPYNAHATAIDALWAGLPLLTCAGTSFASRVGASLLTAIGMPELITSDPAQYEERAVHLATHPGELAQLRQRLADHRLTTPLFDARSFTRRLEAVYQRIHDRHRCGLPPEDFDAE